MAATTLKQMLISGVLLALFAITGAVILAITYDSTREQIAANERAAVISNLNEIAPAYSYDNDPLADQILVTDATFGSDEPVAVYRLRKNGQPVAAIIASQAPNGYSGTIKLLVGIRSNGTLAGVRVVNHKETPGLGDRVEIQRSDWLLQFPGRSLDKPPFNQWQVKKDGGVFDQLTGATITPRAIVQAVKKTLLFFSTHQSTIWQPKNLPPTSE